MADQDIYKLVEELNKKKNISTDNKIDNIYNLLDEVKKENNIKDNNSDNLNEEVNLSSINKSSKPINKPNFPTKIRPYDKRSECFTNIIQEVNYGDNNEDYVNGHKAAMSKYFTMANSNAKDLYVVEGQLNDELHACGNNAGDNYTRGYIDGLHYVDEALLKSKELIEQKIAERLLKELS